MRIQSHTWGFLRIKVTVNSSVCEGVDLIESSHFGEMYCPALWTMFLRSLWFLIGGRWWSKPISRTTTSTALGCTANLGSTHNPCTSTVGFGAGPRVRCKPSRYTHPRKLCKKPAVKSASASSFTTPPTYKTFSESTARIVGGEKFLKTDSFV